jgi:adenylate cyclase
VDFEAEGLLDGLEDEEARTARLDLLRELHEKGVPIDELRKAVEEERLPLLPAELVLEGEGPRYTRDEVADKSGVDGETLEQIWRALGLPVAEPGERMFGEADIEAARRLKLFFDAGLPRDGVMETARVMGSAMSQVADVTRRLVGTAFLREGDTERDAGLRFAEAASRLGPLIGPGLEHLYGVHMREQLRHDVIYQAELETGKVIGTQEVAVCFADLVDFTKLGERVPPEEVGSVAGRLADLAGDVAERPVRLIKTIGDGAMLVSPEPPALVEAALSLVEAADAEGESFPPMRSGIAFGQALHRRGDWYGRPVNLASRVCDVARPGSVLATREVRDATTDGIHWSAAGRKRVKGVREPVAVYRARREPGQMD